MYVYYIYALYKCKYACVNKCKYFYYKKLGFCQAAVSHKNLYITIYVPVSHLSKSLHINRSSEP